MSGITRKSAATGVASLLAVAAFSGLIGAPAAHAASPQEVLAAAANGELGKGPCGSGGYENGQSQSNSCDGRGGQDHAWCADFVGWVWAKANIRGTSMLTDGAASFYEYGQKYGTLSSTPHVGDAIVYNYRNGYADHVAMVTDVSDGEVTITGGNQGGYPGRVSRATTTRYHVGDSPWGQRISGYISPKFQEAAPPSVSLKGLPGKTVSGVAQLSASASQGTYPVASVQYYVDGEPVSDKVTKAPYGFSFDSASVPDGKHILTVEATDTAGTTGTTRAEIITTNGESNSTYKADFNGDGKADIAVLYNYGQQSDGSNRTGLWVYYSEGKSFSNPVKVWDNADAGTGSWNWSRSKITAGDFNGDGKADIGILYNGGEDEKGVNHTALWTLSSNGKGFDKPVRTWESVDSGSGSWNWNRSKVTSGDFNGDGKTDVGVLYNGGEDEKGVNHTALWTFGSNGKGFEKPVRAWESVDAGTGSWNWDRSKAFAGDFNGDGKADVGVLYDNGEDEKGVNHTALWTFGSNGKGFEKPVRTWESVDAGTGSWNWNRSKPVVGDFDGDGKADVAVLYNQGQTEDGRNSTAVWKFTSTGSGFTKPVKLWDNGSDSWNSESSKLVAGDYDGDGKTDLGVLYNQGQTDDKRNSTAVWKFTSTGAGFDAPAKVWDSIDSGTGSWNWKASKLG
ncbi:FG-GAP-like repeat-containing protein [Streptomyces sp. VNUA116]|uniref:FG-GAP-like repeat-containing protein n=1 Tax=Streptomyces sp. VNUA116 TaxID=3062449 RepID=UPI00267533C4|nr:FG-GAP-like repeat-containing protein [Streptomyces sp. VNUA116]WKU46637.1 FG-GAP-like repeat-containing protein [Streptomyces sp. VNUA116]